MDDTTEELRSLSINDEVEHASIEEKPTQCSWLDTFEKGNINNDHNVNEEQEIKSNYGNSSFDNSRGAISFLNGLKDIAVRGKGRGIHISRTIKNQIGLLNHDYNSNSTNNRGTFTLIKLGHDQSFDKIFDDKNESFVNERRSSYNNKDNCTTSSKPSRDQDCLKNFNGENESFESDNNGSFNNRRGDHFDSGYQDCNKRFDGKNESFKSDNNGSFNNRGGDNFDSGYQDHNKRFDGKNESFKSDNNGSFKNRGVSNFASGYRNRNKRFDGENKSFESDNNGSFNKRGGSNFASGYRDRNKRFNGENESFESDNNRSFNNRGGGNFASGFRDRNKRFNGENESFESDNNRNFNNRGGGNFASGHRDRNKRFNSENKSSESSREKFGEQLNDNSLYGNRRYQKNQNSRGSGPKKEYIPPDVDSIENIDGIVAGLNFDKYDTIEVQVSGADPPKRMTSFHDSGLRDILLKNLSQLHFHKPTPVQNYSIPIIMAGRDLMASAQTGSGKTAAYVLPILHNLLRQPLQLTFDQNHCEPHVIIIAPTRELVIQINQFVWRFTKGTSIKCKVLYGGASAVFQKIKLLESGVHVLSATPGRLLDFVKKNIVTFSSVKFFVLDEADRMLAMGFKQDIEYILKHSTMNLSNARQTVMFSATFPPEIQHLATQYLKPNYLFVAAGEVGAACKDVVQTIKSVKQFDKKRTLLNLITEMETYDGTIVFVEKKRTADYIAAYLSENDLPTTSIHGDREQPERELALKDFKTNDMKILVATAVAARGLDIKNVNTVVNFDLPTTIDEYVHRIGRTGRLGNTGKAISFFDPDCDRSLTPDLIKTLQHADQEVPPWLHSLAESSRTAPDVASFNDIRTNVEVAFELETEEWGTSPSCI